MALVEAGVTEIGIIIAPETGEEIYHSFLGVPILRAGNTLGVLVVQNRAKRTYVEEEVEALQTTAMVLAEMIASGELSALAQPGAEPAARHSVHKTGAILSDGIALGHVVLHEPRVVITNYIAEDLPKEIKRLDAALTLLNADEIVAGLKSLASFRMPRPPETRTEARAQRRLICGSTDKEILVCVAGCIDQRLIELRR